MNTIRQLLPSEFPKQLLEIPHPPKKLYIQGSLPTPNLTMLCIVGSRNYSEYGKRACEHIMASLKDKPIAIISGLAIGIDAIAHTTALQLGLYTLALPGSGLNPANLHPQSNRKLADKIVASGGGLLSEFNPDFKATQWSFPQRNRIMAGLSQAVLIIESEKKSGTLITARLATDYGRDVLTIPGSIFSKNSAGPNSLLKLGATPIMSGNDLLEALGFEQQSPLLPAHPENMLKEFDDCTPQELKVLKLLIEPKNRDELIRALHITAHEINIILSLLEIKGYITETMGQICKKQC